MSISLCHTDRSQGICYFHLLYLICTLGLALNSCDEDECPHTNSNGIRGRVCDDSCADGIPYGTLGCAARDGSHGNYCRVCYFDQDAAIAADSADERAIM